MTCDYSMTSSFFLPCAFEDLKIFILLPLAGVKRDTALDKILTGDLRFFRGERCRAMRKNMHTSKINVLRSKYKLYGKRTLESSKVLLFNLVVQR